MADLGDTSWSETDASNNAAPPNGWPEGMNPSDVNNSARADKGGVKRFWDRNNVVKTTAGTSTAYTLAYDVAAAAYYNGEKFSFIVNATCGSAPTLNINALGAFSIRKFSGGAFTNLVAGDIVANQPLEVYYNSSATTFDIITQVPSTVWQALGTADPSGASTVDFTSISSSINHIEIRGELTVSSAGVSVSMQTYDGTGTLNTGGTDYSYVALVLNATGSGTSGVSTTTGSAMTLALAVDTGTYGLQFTIFSNNIQRLTNTKFDYSTNYLRSSVIESVEGHANRASAARITGVRILVSGGTVTGHITLYGSSN